MSYLTTFACQFGRYRYKKFLFGEAPEGDMFQRKIDDIFKDLPGVFGIVDNILVVGYDRDGKGHNETVCHLQNESSTKMQTSTPQTK